MGKADNRNGCKGARRGAKDVSLSRWVALFVAVDLAAFLIFYMFFMMNGPIPVGQDLTKESWLVFLGSFLAFSGSMFLGIVAIYQNVKLAERDDSRRAEDREKAIRPILSVSIVGRELGQFVGKSSISAAKAVYPGSVSLQIRNSGSFPVFHLVVFDRYQIEQLDAGGTMTVVCGYGEVPQALAGRRSVIRLGADYERDDSDMPMWFNVSYIDADGVEWFQTFALSDFDGEKFYRLDSIEKP